MHKNRLQTKLLSWKWLCNKEQERKGSCLFGVKSPLRALCGLASCCCKTKSNSVKRGQRHLCFGAKTGMHNFTLFEVKSFFFRLTRPVRALSTTVSLPKSSGTCSSSVSGTGSIFCRLVLVVSPLVDMGRVKGQFLREKKSCLECQTCFWQFYSFTYTLSAAPATSLWKTAWNPPCWDER